MLSLDELTELRSSGTLLYGEHLLTKGLIDAPKLEGALREQLARRLRYVAAMPPDTTYAYYDKFDALQGWGETAARGVDPLPMLWDLLRESTPRSHIEAALGRVAGSSLRIAKTASLARLGLGPGEHAAVEMLRGRPLTASEFPRMSGLAEVDAQLLTYLLLVTKQVDVLSAGHSARPSAPPRVSAAPNTPVPPSPPSALAKSLFPPGHVGRSKPPPGMVPELSERWKAIVERARTIDRADYFTMLELARDATREDAEASFFALAKKWHPDRLPSELDPVRDACSRVFGRMSEAHATLTDAEKRTRYMKLLADGSGSPEMQETVAKVIEAATDFQKAEICFKRNDYAQAETLCRKALKADATQPDYHAMLAWLISIKPESQTPEKAAECIQTLDRAISMNDRCEKAYLWRGMLNKRVGRLEAAVRDFRRAVEINPHNIDAAREVRLHNMRGGLRHSSTPPAGSIRSSAAPGKPSKPDEKPGILGRFFKK